MDTKSTGYLLNFVIPQGPTGPTGSQGSTGPTGPTGASGENLDTYIMATSNTKSTYDSDSPILFNTVNLSNNITYSKGTFTLTDAGKYLINWTASIKNEDSNSVLTLGLFEVEPSTGYVAYSNTGNTISANASTFLSGTAIVSASSGATYQLRNASGQEISTVTDGTVAVTITIIRFS